jgi:hypothetical protein
MDSNTAHSSSDHALSEDSIETLNSLLRGELSAIDTYTQALKEPEMANHSSRLATMLAEHKVAETFLRSEITRANGVPATSSGLWGAFAESVVGVAKMIGLTSTLHALKQGENHGLNSYRSALDSQLPEGIMSRIRNEFIPKQMEHIKILEQLGA